MKKHGFTLAEALIALGIVGVIAALALPMVNKVKPDPIKVTYLKTYDSIVSAVKTFSALTPFYAPSGPNGAEGLLVDEGFYVEYPLLNDEKAKNGEVKLAAGTRKFCDSLYNSLAVSGANNCSESNAQVDYDTANNKLTRSFKTNNGVEFQVYTKFETGKAGDHNPTTDNPKDWAKFESAIYVDLNGPEGNNCLYNSNTCSSPDRFKFIVGPDGRVYPADPVGKLYLKTRLLSTKVDLDIVDPDIDDTIGKEQIINEDAYCKGDKKTIADNGDCIACASNEVLQNGECKTCGSNQTIENNTCKDCVGYVENNTCKDCSQRGVNYYYKNGLCILCKGELDKGLCKPCALGYEYDGATGCKSKCAGGQVWNRLTNSCECTDGQIWLFNKCVDEKKGCLLSTKPSGEGVTMVTCNGKTGEWDFLCEDGYTRSGNTCKKDIEKDPGDRVEFNPSKPILREDCNNTGASFGNNIMKTECAQDFVVFPEVAY